MGRQTDGRLKHQRICHQESVYLLVIKRSLRDTGSLTCLLSVMALGWHLVQMPFGHGRCPSHPDLILQLMFSRATNFPLREETRDRVNRTTVQIQAGDSLNPLQSAPREQERKLVH